MRKEDMTTFEFEGRIFHIEFLDDYDSSPPWKESDGHGPVSEWTCRDKKAGEWVLCEDYPSRRYYDFAEAMRIAKRDGWGAPPYGVGTKGERAVRAVTADFEYLRRWCTDQWKYVTLHIVLFNEDDDDILYEDYLGRVEYDYTSDGYWLEEARGLAANIMDEVRDQEQKMKIANRFREAMECGL